jgi:hypothetical protein
LNHHSRLLRALVPLLLTLAVACGDDSARPTGSGTGGGGGAGGGDAGGTALVFDLAADTTTPEGFYAQPWPLDTRVTADGAPDWSGLPNPGNSLVVNQFKESVKSNRGFPTLPVALFQFDGPLAPRVPTDVLSRGTDRAPIIMVSLDGLRGGELVPVVAQTLEKDAFTPENVLAVAPRPGWVLRPRTRYGVFVMTNLGDAAGQPLAKSPLLARLEANAPDGDAETAMAAVLDTPFWDSFHAALRETGGAEGRDIAAATAFTTGDVVAEMEAVVNAVGEAHDPPIEDLALRTEEERENPYFCELRGTITYPQFQEGDPPFAEKGLFVPDDSGVPTKQRDETAPVEIYIPKMEMPEGGYPLMISIHGSGGFSDAAAAPLSDDGLQHFGLGPAFNFTEVGLAVATSAMPLNPERFEGASETEYLNPNNFAAMRDTFRQGQIESHLFIEALRTLEIDPALLDGCAGPTLPEGETAFRFSDGDLGITGQSMGGMYANQVAALEPRVKVSVPTGAGGHWTYFILVTSLIPNLDGLLKLVIGTQVDLTFTHPTMSLAAAGLEAADPIVFIPRISRRPLPGHPVRPIYEPVGLGDSYFPPEVYDAVALAYGHKQAGDVVWPSMQEALALADRDGVLDFPLADCVSSEDGRLYTGVVTQWEGDGVFDPHAIYVRNEEVRYQYTCFLDSFFRTGTATVFPPLSWEDEHACPE